MKKKLYIGFSILIILVVSIVCLNYFTLQRHMEQVLKDDPRNQGVKVWVYYKWLVNPNELNYDLRSISGENSNLDVQRVMLQFSEKIQDKHFNKVYLAYKGHDKFYFKGDYFQNIGKEYNFQNPVYTLRTMPENVYNLDDTLQYGVWTGGWLGVTGKQMEDLNTFAKEWYLNDLVFE